MTQPPLYITDRRARAALLGIEPAIHLDALGRDIVIASSVDGRELCCLTALTLDAPQSPSAAQPSPLTGREPTDEAGRDQTVRIKP